MGRAGQGGAKADIVLTVPRSGVPLLFIEVDHCHETAEEIAARPAKYHRFFRRQVKDTDGKGRPMWRTRWSVRAEYGQVPRPPVLLVFNHIGDRSPNRTIPRLRELTSVGGAADQEATEASRPPSPVRTAPSDPCLE
ncbi:MULTISPECIES: hypothetical protein [unclassified Streptomyces]|uniref:hypothetical protein n=1 Tax=unclassified Streptomyces TaxID=2593676 RepID=UPI0034429AD3